MGLNVSYGDGSPFTALKMHEIRSVIHKHMVYSRWELGNIMCIDNFAVSHGRQPTYDNGRKVVVAWSDAVAKTITFKCAEDEHVLAPTDSLVSGAANPQERAPESTLTSEDAKTLKEAVLEKHVDHKVGGDLVNAKVLEAALARKTTNMKDSSGLRKRVHSQPLLLHPSSEFWKEAS